MYNIIRHFRDHEENNNHTIIGLILVSIYDSGMFYIFILLNPLAYTSDNLFLYLYGLSTAYLYKNTTMRSGRRAVHELTLATRTVLIERFRYFLMLNAELTHGIPLSRDVHVKCM